MGFFKKKTFEIEAHVFTGSSTSASQIKGWVENGVWDDKGVHTRDYNSIEVSTGNGLLTVNPGDYVIKLPNGNFSVLASDSFNSDYEALDNADREPGDYPAKDLRLGDFILCFGKEYQITKVQISGDDVKVDLNDGTTLSFRNTALIKVTKVG